MTDILMPALSPTMEEGTLAKWLVKPGDRVEAGQVIAEIETDKATMEVEAVDEGVVSEVLVEAGTEGVKVNAVIARLEGEGAAAAAPSTAVPAVPLPRHAGEDPAPTGSSPALAGKGDRAQRGGGGEDTRASAASAPPEPAAGETGESLAAPTPPDDGARVAASPLARRLAKLAGIDLAGLTGSGPHGRIVKRDVDEAAGKSPVQDGAAQAAPATPPPTAAAPAAAPKTLQQIGIPAGSYDLVPLDNVRRISANRLTEAARDIPHFPLTIDLEIDRLLDARARINAVLESQGVKVSVNDLVLKAAATALKRVPEANASYTPEGIALHHAADIAMAVAIDGGLITPIIFAADSKGLAQIATEAKDLAARARARKLKPQEFQGGTFSVSNLGMFGVRQFSSIINPPHGAILSVGAGEPRPLVRNGALVVATLMTVTLTCDHRVVDGATGARWLQALKALIEEPVTMLV